jgi:hypothetical protein
VVLRRANLSMMVKPSRSIGSGGGLSLSAQAVLPVQDPCLGVLLG